MKSEVFIFNRNDTVTVIFVWWSEWHFTLSLFIYILVSISVYFEMN